MVPALSKGDLSAPALPRHLQRHRQQRRAVAHERQRAAGEAPRSGRRLLAFQWCVQFGLVHLIAGEMSSSWVCREADALRRGVSDWRLLSHQLCGLQQQKGAWGGG